MKKTYEYYVDNNNLHCVVGTTYSMDGYDEMVEQLTKESHETPEFIEVPAPDPIDYDGIVW